MSRNSSLIFIAPDDYSSIDIPLVFVPDDLSNRGLCKNISIATDLVVENTEVFTLSLSTTDSAVSLQVESSLVNIIDDSGEGGSSLNLWSSNFTSLL